VVKIASTLGATPITIGWRNPATDYQTQARIEQNPEKETDNRFVTNFHLSPIFAASNALEGGSARRATYRRPNLA
jgi:hypothetical protein